MAIFTLARDFDDQGDGVNGQSAGSDIDFSCVIRANYICSGIFDRCRCRLLGQDRSLAICSCLDLRLPDELIVVFECSVLRRIRQAELIVRRQSKRAQVVANYIAVFVDDYMRAAACDTADGRLICIRHIGCIIGHAGHSIECCGIGFTRSQCNRIPICSINLVGINIPRLQEAADALVGIGTIYADQLESTLRRGIVRAVIARTFIGVPELSLANGIGRIE